MHLGGISKIPNGKFTFYWSKSQTIRYVERNPLFIRGLTMSTNEKKLFKDWFDQEMALLLSKQLKQAYPHFDGNAFLKQATNGLEHLEMNARVAQFSEALAAYLPENKENALKILTQSLPDLLPRTDEMTIGWLQWPVGKFIADYGLPHFETSMIAMIELTQRFTSEFAVRPFIEKMPERTISELVKLCDHPSPHVRRWCSEGTRPLLPWGKKLHALVKDPSPVWPILEALKDDPEKYVQKSVGNHLNDIAKHHPDLVVARCKTWMRSAGAERKWIIQRGLRTLIKDGHPEALELMGYSAPKKIKATVKLSPKKITVGEATELRLTIANESKHSQKLLIDYAVIYIRKQQNTGRKVFKWTTTEIGAGEKVEFTKKHPMKKTTTRALYPGKHVVEVMVNGQILVSDSFELD